MSDIIKIERCVVPACDVGSLEEIDMLALATAENPKIGGYKIGVSLLDRGLCAVVERIRNHTDKPIIYDHQKAGTDIPEETPDRFMDAMVRAGVNAVILFPQAGPVSQYEWTKAAQDRALGVIVGGEMTHPRYLEGDFSNSKVNHYSKIFFDLIGRDITGYIRSAAPGFIYELAAAMVVTNFVMPGNKPGRIAYYKELIAPKVPEPRIWSPGLVTQGGDISEGATAAGTYFRAIVGRALTGKKTVEEIKQAALDLTAKL
jgi:orotidine-5'-phosphate decarboxylase